MLRLCRAHRLGIWGCAVLVVFSYVLFDLLDIDGSNFDHSPGSGLVAEERIAGEEEHPVTLGVSTPVLLPAPERGRMLQSAPTCTVTLPRPVRPHGRPRGALSVHSTASPPAGKRPRQTCGHHLAGPSGSQHQDPHNFPFRA